MFMLHINLDRAGEMDFKVGVEGVEGAWRAWNTEKYFVGHHG